MYLESYEDYSYRLENANSFNLEKNIYIYNKMDTMSLNEGLKSLKIKKNDEIKTKIFNSMIRLVVGESKKYAYSYKLLGCIDDLIQEGSLTLWKYIDKHDIDSKYAFTTCLMYRLKSTFTKFREKEVLKLSAPSNTLYFSKKLKSIIDSSDSSLEAKEKFREEVGSISDDRYESLLNVTMPPVNIDAKLDDSDESSKSIGDMIASGECVDEEVITDETRSEIMRIIRGLSSLEYNILTSIYENDIDKDINKKMNELARDNDISIFRITAIRLNIENKIKNNKQIKSLLEIK